MNFAMKKLIFIISFIFINYNLILAETKTAIRLSELNQLILDDIHKNFPDYSINEAFKVNNKEIISYEVIIKNEKYTLNLYYTNTGKFIRKEIPHPKENSVATQKKI